jgi:hypothetical protein
MRVLGISSEGKSRRQATLLSILFRDLMLHRRCRSDPASLLSTNFIGPLSQIQEAHYVTAVSNSETANEAIKPFQSTGLLGRTGHRKEIARTSIPFFDRSIDYHVRLAELVKARVDALKVLDSGQFPASASLAKQRAFHARTPGRIFAAD